MKVEDLDLDYGQQELKLYDQCGRVFTLAIEVDEQMGKLEDDDEYFGEIKSLNRNHYNFTPCTDEVQNKLEELCEPVVQGIEEIMDRYRAEGTTMSHYSQMQREIKEYKRDNGVSEIDALRAHLNEEHKHWRQLSYYEHGNSIWWPTKDGNPGCPDMQWDGAGFAGWWVPAECWLECYTDITPEELDKKLDECCTAVCKQYTQWANGEIFYYRVELDDSAYGGEEIMSCGGYYGSDHKESGLWEQLLAEMQCAGIKEVLKEKPCQAVAS